MISEEKPLPMAVEDVLDEAVKPEEFTWTPEEEKRAIRKLDLRLVLPLSFCYLMAFLDRGNIGNANTAGMSEDLNMTDGQYQWLLTIFYLGYILFQWFTMMYKIVPPHIWLTSIIFVWGLCSVLQSVAQNWASMMVCRLFLGIAEAGFSGGIPFYFSFFYNRREVTTRFGWFISFSPLGSCFAGAMAYGITHAHSSIANWRLLFLIEGLPTIVMAGLIFFIVADNPRTAKFLTDREKLIILHRSRAGLGNQGVVHHEDHKLNKKELLGTLLDYRPFLMGLTMFCFNVSFSSLPVYLPAIVKGMGFSSINAQGLSAPPYVVAFFVTLGATYTSDKLGRVGPCIVAVVSFGIAGYIMLAVGTGVGVRYAATFLAASGVFPCIALMQPWVITNQGNDSRKAAGTAILMAVGNCGPLLGTRLFPAADAPFFRSGMWASAGCLFASVALVSALDLSMFLENRKLDRLHGKVDKSQSYINEGTLDKAHFRYLL